MEMRLEVVVVPVSDVDRSKEFYADKMGFNVDNDTAFGDDFRVVQLTPPGSGCSVTIGKGLADMAPGSLQGLQLVVADVEADARRAGGPRRRRDGSAPREPGVRRVGGRPGRPLELVHLLQGPGRQRLGHPGGAGPGLAPRHPSGQASTLTRKKRLPYRLRRSPRAAPMVLGV